MGLLFKQVKSAGRGMYLYYPDTERHNPYLTSLITIIRGDDSEESVKNLLRQGLQSLADEKRIVLAFPNPGEKGWNSRLLAESEDDTEILDKLLNEVTKEDDDPLKTNEIGIPLLSEMLRQWHLMNTYRYLIGVDGGADMAMTYAATKPENIAGLLSFGGEISREALEKARYGPVTSVLAGASERAVSYFIKACGCTEKASGERVETYKNPTNEASYVIKAPESSFSKDILFKVYEETFSKVRKINTGDCGDMDTISDLTGDEFKWFIDDESLGEKHTWLMHVPDDLPKGGKVPMILFCHGGSDNPTEAANMARLHELGKKEHFISVYPWGSNTASWAVGYGSDDKNDRSEDEVFLVKLIDKLIAEYPVDPERVYMSGFSNGAAMAQVIAMLYPEKIAGLMHIDSNWPGNRWKPIELDINDITPMRRALEQKKEWMRMPVWYTYGTREASCPVFKGCTQQYQYDFWKRFNNIKIEETPHVGADKVCESGVPGEKVEEIRPNGNKLEQFYTVNRFYTQDPEPKNYYNYCLMHDKGHEVAPKDAELGWNYVKQFKRNPDGTVGLV